MHREIWSHPLALFHLILSLIHVQILFFNAWGQHGVWSFSHFSSVHMNITLIYGEAQGIYCWNSCLVKTALVDGTLTNVCSVQTRFAYPLISFSWDSKDSERLAMWPWPWSSKASTPVTAHCFHTNSYKPAAIVGKQLLFMQVLLCSQLLDVRSMIRPKWRSPSIVTHGYFTTSICFTYPLLS